MRHFRAMQWGLVVALLAVAPAAAQDRDRAQDQDRDLIRQRVQERLRLDESLDGGQRARMEQNLERALRQGLGGEQIEGMFPVPGRDRDLPAAALLRMQERVLATAEAGAPADLLADKLREGRMKGAGPEAVEGVLARLEEQARFAHQTITRAMEQGVSPGDGTSQQQLQRGMALDLWRGLGEGDLDRLREQAQERARDGSCSTVELAAAAESATELIEMGIEPRRAREALTLGLQQGYSAQEMRRLSAMVRAAGRQGEQPGKALEEIEGLLRDGLRYQEMTQQMARHGWMGPADTAGSGTGGHSPVDDVINGPGRHGDGAGQGPGGPGGSGDPTGPGGSGDPNGPGGPGGTGGSGSTTGGGNGGL